MRFTGLLILCLLSSVGFSQGIEFFHGEWKDALEEAKKDDRLIFVDAYAQWCGPCKKMAKNVFTQDAVGDFYNNHFVNLKLDMETEDGRSFGSKYPVSAYPTLLFLNADGEIVKKVTGGQQAEQLIALGELAMKSYDKSGTYAVKYEEGDRSYELMLPYVTELNKVSKPSMKISNDYLNSNPKITAQQKATFLLAAVTESDSKLFDQLIDLKSEVKKAGLEKELEQKVQSAAMASVAKAVEFDYEDLVTEAITKFKSAGVGDAKKFEQEAYLEYHKLSGNYDQWKSMAEKYLKKYGKKDHAIFKQHIVALKTDFKHENDSKPYACEVCKDLLKKDDSAKNYQEYIQLLLDCKKYDEARKVTNQAIEKATDREEDTKKFDRIIQYLDRI